MDIGRSSGFDRTRNPSDVFVTHETHSRDVPPLKGISNSYKCGNHKYPMIYINERCFLPPKKINFS